MHRFGWTVVGLVRLFMAVAHGLLGAVQMGWQFRGADVQARMAYVRRWSQRLLSLLGFDVIETGARPAEADACGLLVSNHVSFIDILLINATAPSAFVSKDGVAQWPLIGYLATKAGTIYLERGSRRAAHRVQERITERLSEHGRVAIFPEGTTTDGLAMLPFHGALFQAAVDAAAPVQCVLIRYLEADGTPSVRAPYVGDISLLDCLWRIAAGPRLSARIEWLAQLAPPHTDRRHLAHHAHQRIAHALTGHLRAGTH